MAVPATKCNLAVGAVTPIPTFPLLVSTYKSSVLTAKSPVVARVTFKLEPEAGVIPTAPVLIKDGVETEVAESNLVAESVSVAKVKSASSESRPAVPAKVTLVAVNPESVIFPPERVE